MICQACSWGSQSRCSTQNWPQSSLPGFPILGFLDHGLLSLESKGSSGKFLPPCRQSMAAIVNNSGSLECLGYTVSVLVETCRQWEVWNRIRSDFWEPSSQAVSEHGSGDLEFRAHCDSELALLRTRSRFGEGLGRTFHS